MAGRYAGTVRAPQFPLDQEWVGGAISLQDLRGKVVLLDFWTSCCINCMHIVRNLHEIERRHPDDLVVIGVHSAKFTYEKQTSTILAAMQRLGIHHRVINDGDHVVWDAYAVRSWPTLMLIDPNGRVIGKHEGEFELESFDAFVREAITEFDQEGQIDRTPIAEPDIPEPEESTLRFPAKLTADPVRERLFIADTSHNRVVETDFAGNILATYGEGALDRPHGLALSPDSTTLAVANVGNHTISSIDLTTRETTRIAGTGEQGYDRDPGNALDVDLASPWDLIWHDGRLLVAMAGWHQIWAYDPSTLRIELLAGTGAESIHDGPLDEATFAQPSGITVAGDRFYIADSESSAVRSIDPSGDRVQRVVGRGLFNFGDIDARGDSVRLQHPLGVVAIGEGERTIVYVADSYNHKIKALSPVPRSVTTRFGSGDSGLQDGDALDASFWEPGGIAIAGDLLFVADTNNHAIRICDLAQDTVETLQLR